MQPAFVIPLTPRPIANRRILQKCSTQRVPKKEIQKTYKHIPFRPKAWRKGKNLPTDQGIILGSVGKKNEVTALVDTDDVHTLMIGASGVGKTTFFLYPNLEYACATGMSFLCTDTKGDLFRNYGAIARDHYGYSIAVILLLAEYLPPTDDDPQERRHIISVFKMVQELLEPSKVRGKSQFQLLMAKLPPEHKARWFAGAALNSAERAMASVMSTVLSRLNAVLDSEMERSATRS